MATGSSDPEEASAYLARTNFKSVIEWLTAESILHRPEDPLTFIRDLVDLKLHERGGGAYDAAQGTKYVQSCYSDAAALADEHGRIYGAVVAPPSTKGAVTDALQARIDTLEKVVHASFAIRDLEPSEACERIVQEGCDLLGAERASIFTLRRDDDQSSQKMLEQRVDKGVSGIVVPFGQGISGTVAATGEVCNIHDAYTDERFDSTADEATGFRTTNVLCGPINDQRGEVVGVLQVINKRAGPFSDDDENALKMLSSLAGVALDNAFLYQESKTAQRRAEAVVDLVHRLHENIGVNQIVFTLTTRLPQTVACDRCTVFVIHRGSEEMWAMQGEDNFKVPLDSTGLASACARSGETSNVADAYADERFNSDLDKQSGYVTKSILSMPIRSSKGGEVVGVVQMVNKERSGVFSADDVALLSVFLDIVGGIMKGLTLATERHTQGGQTTADAKADDSLTPAKLARTSSSSNNELAAQDAIVHEGNEEEEEEEEE